MKLQQMINELESAADLEGTEVGEYWSDLVSLQYKTDGMSPEFKYAWENEIKTNWIMLKNEYKIVEHEYTPTPRTAKRLEYIG